MTVLILVAAAVAAILCCVGVVVWRARHSRTTTAMAAHKVTAPLSDRSTVWVNPTYGPNVTGQARDSSAVVSTPLYELAAPLKILSDSVDKSSVTASLYSLASTRGSTMQVASSRARAQSSTVTAIQNGVVYEIPLDMSSLQTYAETQPRLRRHQEEINYDESSIKGRCLCGSNTKR